MQFAIFDTGAGFLQWKGEATSPASAITAMCSESRHFLDSDQDPHEPFVVVYQLTPNESSRVEDLLSQEEDIFQDFEDEGQDFTLAQIRQLVE